MADQKISELTNITGANLADADEFVVVDVSADQTKAVTRAEFFKDTPDLADADEFVVVLYPQTKLRRLLVQSSLRILLTLL